MHASADHGLQAAGCHVLLREALTFGATMRPPYAPFHPSRRAPGVYRSAGAQRTHHVTHAAVGRTANMAYGARRSYGSKTLPLC